MAGRSKRQGLAALFFFVLAGCAAAPQPAPSGGIAFGLLGDVPYSASEVRRLDGVIDEMNAEELAFAVHLGDLGRSLPEQACGDRWLAARKGQLARLRHPLVVIPGDNEWSDCALHGIDPLERLQAWRGLFCREVPGLRLERQAGPYCEHARWEAAGRVFVTLNIPGNNNNAAHAEHEARMKAVFAWLDEAMALARKRGGLVVLIQANPFESRELDGYSALRERLEALGREMPGKVVLVHGDTHLYRDDMPRPGLRRIETWGSPFVRWTRAVMGPEGLGISSPF